MFHSNLTSSIKRDLLPIGEVLGEFSAAVTCVDYVTSIILLIAHFEEIDIVLGLEYFSSMNRIAST